MENALSKKRKIIFIWLVGIATMLLPLGCAIPQYDQKIEDSFINIYVHSQSLFYEIQQADNISKEAYPKFDKKYNDIFTEIYVLQIKIHGKPYNKDMAKNYDEFIKKFIIFRNLHKNEGFKSVESVTLMTELLSSQLLTLALTEADKDRIK